MFTDEELKWILDWTIQARTQAYNSLKEWLDNNFHLSEDKIFDKIRDTRIFMSKIDKLREKLRDKTKTSL